MLKNSKMKNITKNKIKNPLVIIVGGVHGDELIGLKVIKKLNRLKVKKGSLLFLTGNPEAIRKKKRFIRQDLNRSFPGKNKGNHEERLAYKIKKIISKADYVIDIHSTTTDVKNLTIITKTNSQTMKLVDLLNPERVAVMKKSLGRKSLAYYCKAGIVMEYGKDKDIVTYKNIINDILHFLNKLDMIDVATKKKPKQTKFYKIKGVISKPEGFILNNKIKNFKKIKKGSILAKNKGEVLKSSYDFYPILFGQKSYKDIFGFYAS